MKIGEYCKRAVVAIASRMAYERIPGPDEEQQCP